MNGAGLLAPPPGGVDAVGFPSDPALPRLTAAVDPDVARAVLVRHERSLWAESTRVEGCRVDRVRYRRGERCLVQYTVQVRDGDTGATRRDWVAGSIYAGDRGRRAREKLEGGIPSVFLPELDMIADVYPHDQKLPSLARLATAPPPELTATLLGELGPGPWQAPQWTIDTVRYRAGLGATLRYAVQARHAGSGALRGRRFFVKVYAGDEAARSHARLRTLWEHRRVWGQGPMVPRPVAFVPEFQAVAQEEVGGVTLEKAITTGGDLERVARRVARALATFHLAKAPLAEWHTRDDQAAALARAARLIGWTSPELARETAAVAADIVGGLGEQPLAPTHRDLKLDHVLLDGENVGFVDVDTAALADPLLDIGVLLADTRRLRLGGVPGAERGHAAGRALVDEYLRCVPAAWGARLPLACASAALDKALHFFRRQQPGWRPSIHAMVRAAQAALAGRPVW